MIVFFSTYFLLLLFSSLIIVGWFTISREGMIFEFWSKFWEGKKGTERANSEGEKLYKDYLLIEQVAIKVGYKLPIKYTETHLEATKDFEQYKSQVEHHLLIHLDVQDAGDGTVRIYLYEEKLVFRFPEYIRNPVSSCPTCQSSIYGSIIYWTVMALVNVDLFVWTDHRVVVMILTWVAFEFSLAFLNTYINSKIK